MRLGLGSWIVAGCMMITPAWAQWESGSDGSDGAFAPGASVEVDLGLAASLCDCDGDTQVDDECRWDCPSPIAGQGVYDAEQFVIVYKYSTINVPAGVTVSFKNHPSNPPVVWLATGNVTISGTVSVDGKNGTANNPIPTFTLPGPGGFAGNQGHHAGLVFGQNTVGFGPGGRYNDSAIRNYGNSNAQPLTGGSGGGPGTDGSSNIFGGGGGAGAMLIASNTSIVLGSASQLRANGGTTNFAYHGSGGDIRLRAETLAAPSGSQISVFGSAGNGRVRIEAFTLTNNATIQGPLSVTNTPSVVFVTDPPQLRIVAMCGEFAPFDPTAGIASTEVEFNSGSPCVIDIEAEGIPVGTTVGVRIVPARGPLVTATSTPLADAGGGLRTATATVTFPPGLSEVQLRANW